jgi:DNA-binding transcriptional regulator YbjK
MAQTYQKGERRREEIIRATLRVIGRGGTGAVTHRAVAEEAGVPLSATTYYFESKDRLLEETLAAAAHEDTERLERLVVELAPQELTPLDWAHAIAAHMAHDVKAEPDKHIALAELSLEASRTAALLPELHRWQQANLRLAELGARAAGSDNPAADARIIVATLSGLMLELLAGRGLVGEDAILPVLERLFTRLLPGVPAGV